MTNQKLNKKDFVELKYTGYVNGNPFDSNVEEDLKKIHPEAKVKKTIVSIGEGMLVLGLDSDLEGKELNKDYEVVLKPKQAFGERDRNLVRTIPLNIFTEQRINPYPGLVLNMDSVIAKVITVSGARVLTDFNNPLAGKEVTYKYKVIRRIEDEKEKVESVLEYFMKMIPEYEIKDKVIIKGPKAYELFVKSFKEKFKEIIGKELAFEEKTNKTEKNLEKKIIEKKE